jgi:hypothetical protein
MMLAIDAMGNTWTFIFTLIALVLFLGAGLGIKPAGDRIHLVGLGLAAMVFPELWTRLANL